MSQSALPGLSRPVQPQIPLKSVLGQGGHALLGESAPGQDLELFSGLLAKASEGDAAAAGDSFSASASAGGDLPVMKPDLSRDEKGESAIAGLAGELPASSVSQVLPHVAPGLIASAPPQGVIAHPAVGEGNAAQQKAQTPFVPAPQTVPNVARQPNRTDAPARSEVAQLVARQRGTGVAGVAVAAQANSPTTASGSAALLSANQQTKPAGQILPQKSEELVAASVGLSAREAKTIKEVDSGRAVPPSVEAVQNTEGLQQQVVGSAAADLVVKQTAETENEQHLPVSPKTGEVAKVVSDLGASVTEALAASRKVEASQQSQPTNTPMKTELSSGAVVDSAAVTGNGARADVVAQDNAGSVDKTSTSEKTAGSNSADIVIKGNPQPSAASRQISELVTGPEVKAIKVQAEPAPIVLPEVKGAGLAADGGELFRQSDRVGSSFVGQQQHVPQSVPVAGEGDVIFPNVMVKSDGASENADQAAQVQKLAEVTAAQEDKSHVRVAEHASRTPSIGTTAALMVGKDRAVDGSVAVTSSSDGSAESGEALETEDQTISQSKVADQNATGNKKSAAASVSIQVSVQQGNEQTATAASFGWGGAAGMQDGAEGELDWQSSEAIAGTMGRSEAGLRSVGSLPTSTLRNVANSVWPEIARQASGGVNRFEIRLDPKELGGIDVSLEFTKDGRVRAHLMVERPETLELLQRDQRGLEKALQEAGVESDKSSLEFSLGRGGGGSQALTGKRVNSQVSGMSLGLEMMLSSTTPATPYIIV